MKNMFRSKDRRKIMRTRSAEAEQSRVTAGIPTPIPPVPEAPSPPQVHVAATAPPPHLTRRSTFHRTQASLAQYRSTPITKHYALNNQILTAFEMQYENNLFAAAYAIGLQFVETALLEIPKHGYFYSNRHAQERTTNSLNAIRVSNMLQTILEGQQANPTQDFGIDLRQEINKVQKLARLALDQAGDKTMEEYEEVRAKLEAELNEMKKLEAPTTMGEASLFDSFSESMYTQTMAHMADAVGKPQPAEPNTKPGESLPPLQPPGRTVSSFMREIMSQSADALPPAGIPPPPPPPGAFAPDKRESAIPGPPALEGSFSGSSWMVMPDTVLERPEFGRQMSGRTYADHVALERALYLSGLEVQPDVSQAGNRMAVPEEDDEQWMLEHALKESEREMEKWRQQEELQILEACQQSEQQHYHHPQQTAEGMLNAPQLQRRVTKTRLEIDTLHLLYHEDFLHLWTSGRVRVTHVDTYQGKNPGSTNGCTVIAPLLCIHHFINFTEPGLEGAPADDPGLPDETIKSVIDEEVPSILPKVREELGVVQDAFLIPSDSHDYLLKNQLLSQDQFVTVIGGNILDERHLNELIRTLVDGCPPLISVTQGDAGSFYGEAAEGVHPHGVKSSPPTKRRDLSNAKIACTLFFHEHVVSILKLRRAHSGKAWFDIIDSLPSRQMLSREVGTSTVAQNNSNGVENDSELDEFGFALSDVEDPMNCARIRCLDEEALSAALRWYACARFNPENLNYIDTYPWDDHSTDFDPRVFQAFVWTEAA